MGAIGDYVHYNAANYDIAGINHATKPIVSSPEYGYSLGKESARVASEMNHYQSPLKEPLLTEVREKIAYIFSGNATGDDPLLQQYQQILQNAISDKFLDKAGTIDFSLGRVTAANMGLLRDEALNTIKDYTERKTVHLNTIESRVNELQTLVSQMSSSMQQTQLQTLLNNIYTTFSNVFRELETGADDTLGSSTNFNFEQLNNRYAEITKNPDSNMIADINTAIKMLTVTPPLGLETGILGEYAVEMAFMAAMGASVDEIEAAIRAGTSGSGRLPVKINIKALTDQFKVSLSGISYNDVYNDEIYLKTPQGQGTQQKADVQIKLGNSQSANISVKNYNLQSGYNVHILSGSTLLYLLQTADSDFINHYLNLVAAHKGSSNQIAQNVFSAREQVKMTVLWEALSGSTYGREQGAANTFIMLDNSRTGIDSVQIYDLPTLFEKILGNVKNLAMITANGADLDAVSFKNAWNQGSYEARISQLLGNMNSYKISVTLSPAVFTSA